MQHTKLQHYYEVVEERVSAEVARVVVWEGAARNSTIESSLSSILDEDSDFIVSQRLKGVTAL